MLKHGLNNCEFYNTLLPDFDKTCMCICDILEIINFTNGHTWLSCFLYVHEATIQN